MALPSVKIKFNNGAISSVVPSADKVVGMIVSAAASGGFALNKAYNLYHLSDLESIGVTKTNNSYLYEQVRQFYAQAGEGAELWIWGTLKSDKPSAMLDKDVKIAPEFIKASNGRIRILAACWDSTGSTITGIDPDVEEAIANGQELGEWATETLYAPILTCVYVYGYTNSLADTITDLTQGNKNRVSAFIGTINDVNTPALATFVGKIASCEVQTHIGKVSDGALNITKAYVGGVTPENAKLEQLNNKGYNTFRTFVGKSGYFVSEDHTATSLTDDDYSIANRRVIDTAYRLAYSTLLEFVNGEVPVTDNGTMPAGVSGSIQGAIESTIINNMTAYGNLGNDPDNSNDTGVKCYIDPSQNVVSTSTIKVNIKVKPYGYARYIEANLGFFTI